MVAGAGFGERGMTCAEFQRHLPDWLDEGGGAELESHLKGCPDCAELAVSLQAIASEARTLQASEEPSPRVWNSIEIELRKKGLIRQPPSPAQRSILPFLTRRWGVVAWLVPAAAALLVGSALFLYQRPGLPKIAWNTVAPPVEHVTADEQLLKEVAAHAPTMRDTYKRNLEEVNAYIKDAEETVKANPNDEDAQQALMDAYGQKSMIYEMALDRSLP